MVECTGQQRRVRSVFLAGAFAICIGNAPLPVWGQTQPPVEPVQGGQVPPPPVEPPSIDPGIVQQPKTIPPPDAVVTPPVVDPEMAVDPETRQPAIKANPPTPEQHVPPPAPPEPIPIPPRMPSPSP